MQQGESIPCQLCRSGLHRICSQPVAIPTLLAYLRGRNEASSETLMCCDRKEFWTTRVYD